MSAFNIEINGQKSFNVPIVIERAMPAQLETYMSNGEWNSFCDQVDNALAPAMLFKQNTMARFKLLCSIPLALMLAFVGVSSSGILTPSDPGFIVMFLIWPVVVFLVFKWLMSKTVRESNQIKADMGSAVDTENLKRSDVTFALKERVLIHYGHKGRRGRTAESYIECTVPSTGIPTGSASAPTSIFDSMGSALGGGGFAPAPASSGRSVAERLQELEGIKALISEADYNNKKNEILASLF